MEQSQEKLAGSTLLDQMADAERIKEEQAFLKAEEGKAAQRHYAEYLRTGGKVDEPKSLDDFLRNLNHAGLQKPKARKQVMPYEDGKKLFHVIANTLGNFEYNEFNKPMLADLVKYFIADPTGIHDLERGIFLCGMPGIGKTHLFRIFGTMVRSFNNPAHEFKTYCCVGLYDSLRTKQSKISNYVNDHAFFDDLGYETKTGESVIKDYGNVSSPIDDIIFEREKKWELFKQRTHFTSNLSPDEIKARYGDRTYDRLKNLCNVVYNSQKYSFRGQ